jgi:hypothetical protein
VAGASQLGVAYGLGVLRLTRVLDVTARDQWVAQLTWVGWIAMTSAVAGAMAGRVLLPRSAGAGTRLVTAVAAALGAAIVVPLTMQPARTAQVDGVHPVFVIGVCAGLGVVLGVPAAYAAVARAVARWNLAAVSLAVWVLAIGSAVPSLDLSGPLPAVRLGVLDARFLSEELSRRSALLSMPVLALLAGVTVGIAARRRAMSTAEVALAGLAGPGLLTLAYLLAGPGDGADHYQVVPYWAAMTAAGAGVLGSVLVAVLSRRPAAPVGGAEPVTGQPAPNRPPLPRREAQPSSAIAQAAAAAAQRTEEQLRPSDTGVFTAAPGQPTARGVAPRPQPQAMNPPPAAPPPVNPPRPTTPAPRSPGRDQRGDEFVDWVSGLGNR